MSKRVLWVVEFNLDTWPLDRWEPSVYVGLSREDAREEAVSARLNEGIRTRIVKYVPEEGA